MSMNYRTEEYYKRFIELQEKLRKSEEERLKLEMKFNEMVRVTREEEQTHYRKLRAQYKRFLEEDRRRQDRNERILRTLDRIDSRVASLIAKTDRFKALRQQYQIYLDRMYRTGQAKTTEVPQMPKETTDDKKTPIDDKGDIVQTYLQNLSSNKLREMLKKEEESRPRLPVTITTDADDKYDYSDLYSFNNGELRPNYANTIADDIMQSIYSRHGRPSDNKSRQPREFNNNLASTSVAPETQRIKNYGDTSSGSRKYSTGLMQNDAQNIVPDDTETDDFSESEEILYKNPSEFNKAKWRTPSAIHEAKLTSFDNNLNAANRTQTDPILSDSVKDLQRRNAGKDAFLPETSKDQVSHVENNLAPVKVQQHQDNIVHQKALPENTSKESIVNQTLSKGDLPGKFVNPVVTKASLNQYNKEFMNPQMSNENEISNSRLNLEEPKETEKDYIPDYTENVNFDKHLAEQQRETAEEPLPQDKVRVQERSQEPRERPQMELPPQQIQEQQPQQQFPEQQIVEEKQPNVVPTNYEEINDKSLVQDNIQQPLEQYAPYDQYNQPVNAETDQLYPMNQYDENSPPVQEYDDQLQFRQQYDESSQPVGQYDDTSQPIQQFDETGQPIGQYPESAQPIQEYDETGQPIGQYPESAQPIQQYDETGQSIDGQYPESAQRVQQYDETGQPMGQYPESAQPIQQYDETGQPIDGQYPESAQPIQQYDEAGQLIGQYPESAQPIQQQYDEAGQPIGQYPESAQPIQQQYDEQGQPIQQYDEQGKPLQQFNQQGEYDEQSQYLQQYGTPQYDEQGQLIYQYDEHGQVVPQYDEHGQLLQQYDASGQLVQQYGESQQYDENGQLIQSYDYGEGSQPQYDENGQLIQQSYDNQQYYGQGYEQNVEPADDQQSVAPVSQEVAAENASEVKESKEEPKKPSNVMEMLDTDTESMKQDTKVSQDSDFDFSNS